MTEQAAKGVIRRLTVSIVAIVLLTAALTVTTFILVVSTVSTSGHPFSTGSVTLNLNDGKPIVSAGGMHVCARAEHGKKFYGGKPQHLRGVV